MGLPVSMTNTVSLRFPVSRPSAGTAAAECEWSFLLAASSLNPDTQQWSRLRCVLDKLVWEALLRLANDHGTSSLLYQNCLKLHDAVPPAALAELRQRHETNVHKSLFFSRELIRILDCLDGLGVETIPYKGVVLSEVYYGDMAMRQSGDIDLFVRSSDVARIKESVLALGYAPRVSIPDAAWQNYLASGYECTFDGPAGQNFLELQWALQPRFYSVDFDMDELFQRAVNVTVADRSMKTLSPEDLLLVLSVHAAKHVWERLIWLCDIARILKLEHLDWAAVQSRSRETGVERILHITLLLTNRFLAEPIPKSIERAVLVDQNARILADEIAAAVRGGVSYEEQQLSYFRLMMRLRERKADRVRFLTRLTFTPGPGEWHAIRLQKVLFPLYRVVRLARLASRFARQ